MAYQLQTAIKPGQAVTYSAPAGWASTAMGPAPAIAAGSPVNNYAGQLEPQFAVTPTMKVGANHSSGAATSYSPCPIGQDLSVRYTPPPTTVGADSWISSQTYSRLGVAAGPTVCFQGRGTGAVATCTIVGGSIQSIQVANPGAAYSSDSLVSIVGGGGGGGATATCTVGPDQKIASVAVTNSRSRPARSLR